MPARAVVKTARALAAVLASSIALLLLPALSTVARADELADATRLFKAGKVDDASKIVDAYLMNSPRDPRMRFLKGVMLMDQKKTAEAQAVFERLTQDYPELPEPYNNLAVIYAGQGDYARAQTALEMVVRANPNYAVAYENLGDVHLKLASQAYANAKRLEPGSRSADIRLNAIRALQASIDAPAPAAPVSPAASAGSRP